MASKFLTPGVRLYEDGDWPLVSIIARDHAEARRYWLEAVEIEDEVYDFEGPIRVHSEWLVARRVTARMIEDGEASEDCEGGFTTYRVSPGARGSAQAWSLGPPHVGWSVAPYRFTHEGRPAIGVNAEGATIYDAKCDGQEFRGTEPECSAWVRERVADAAEVWIAAYDAEHELLAPASGEYGGDAT